MSRLKAKEMQYSIDAVIDSELESELLKTKQELVHWHQQHDDLDDSGISFLPESKTELRLKLQTLLTTL